MTCFFTIVGGHLGPLKRSSWTIQKRWQRITRWIKIHILGKSLPRHCANCGVATHHSTYNCGFFGSNAAFPRSSSTTIFTTGPSPSTAKALLVWSSGEVVGCGPPFFNVRNPYGKSLHKPYIVGIYGVQSPRIPTKHNKYHGYTVRGTSNCPLNWNNKNEIRHPKMYPIPYVHIYLHECLIFNGKCR